MQKLILVSASALMASAGLASPAFAQSADSSGGVYVSGSAGILTSDSHLINGATAAGAPRRIITDMENGLALAFAVGYATKEADWGRVRAELEYGRRQANLRALSLNGVNRALIGEPDKVATTGMVNAFYDSPTFLGPVRAELGVGVGYSKVDYNVRYNVTATGPAIEIPTNPTQFGYQLIGGFSGRVTRKVELFTQFRYLKISDHLVDRFNRTAGTLDSVLTANYDAKSVMFGARYVF